MRIHGRLSNLRKSENTRWSWLRGVVLAAPIVMGYIPIGFAYGVLAQQAGLSTRNTVLMSLLVYAGSAQLIALGLFAAGLPALSIILTTFVVNVPATDAAKSLMISAQSFLGDEGLIAARTPEARNPFGAVTLPDTSFMGPSPRT